MQACGLDEPSEQLHSLPLLDFPCLGIKLSYTWLLADNRSANEHHLFPIALPVSLRCPIYCHAYLNSDLINAINLPFATTSISPGGESFWKSVPESLSKAARAWKKQIRSNL